MAVTAASTRDIDLADSLRVIMRRYRYDLNGRFKVSMNDYFKVILISSASRSEMSEWMSFIGESLVELAFGNLENAEVNELHALIACFDNAFTVSRTDLWIPCGQAEAALKSFFGE